MIDRREIDQMIIHVEIMPRNVIIGFDMPRRDAARHGDSNNSRKSILIFLITDFADH